MRRTLLLTANSFRNSLAPIGFIMKSSKRPPPPLPPFHALVVVAAAWLFFAVTIAIYAAATLLLLPLLPLFAFAPVCLLVEAHAYAARARDRQAPLVHQTEHAVSETQPGEEQAQQNAGEVSPVRVAGA